MQSGTRRRNGRFVAPIRGFLQRPRWNWGAEQRSYPRKSCYWLSQLNGLINELGTYGYNPLVKAWRRYRGKVGLGAFGLVAIEFALQFVSVLLNVNTP